MREEPDSLCATFINLELPSTDLDEGVFDAMDKFIENAKLAGALGFRGHEHVARLTEEVAESVSQREFILARKRRALKNRRMVYGLSNTTNAAN